MIGTGAQKARREDQGQNLRLVTNLGEADEHTIREKTKLLNRVRRIRGQVEAIERALEGERGCAEVMHLVAAARGAMNGSTGVQ